MGVGGFASDNYWSSSENDANNAWNQNFNNGNQNNNNKTNTNYVRPVRGFHHGVVLHVGGNFSPTSFLGTWVGVQLELFPVDDVEVINDDKRVTLLVDLLEAYFSCRRNKRNTINALAFEVDYESHLIVLRDEIMSGSYRPGRSVAFIVDKPVKREIFAADFRDRVVHHLVINKLNPLFEREFINDSYACRVGKGTLFGIHRLESFIRRCSLNDTTDCYVLKIDIKGFFMHIDTDILWQRLEKFIEDKYHEPDKALISELCRVIVMNRSEENCVIKGKRSDWDGLPRDKSLFYSPAHCGLPIGNLSSQVFANFYLNTFDHFVKHFLGVKFYGRYVDDCVFVHPDRAYLVSLLPVLRGFLQAELSLELHPKKISLQHYSHGVPFLGAFILPGRTYVGKRIKGNWVSAIRRHNGVAADHVPDREETRQFVASMNSYLGVLGHFRTRSLRHAMVKRHVKGWWGHTWVNGNITKFSTRHRSSRRF